MASTVGHQIEFLIYIYDFDLFRLNMLNFVHKGINLNKPHSCFRLVVTNCVISWRTGSSIMPGKVNPTQCEALTMVCAQVGALKEDIIVLLKRVDLLWSREPPTSFEHAE